MSASQTRCGVLCLCLLLLAGPVLASGDDEVAKIGFSSNHIFDSAIQGEHVDILSGNVTLSIPIGPRYMLNDWFGYQVKLHYNSKVWDHDCYGNLSGPCYGELLHPDDYGQGFLLHFGRIYQKPSDADHVYRYQEPNGADHLFCDPLDEDCTVTGVTFDGAYWVNGTPGSWIVYPGDGSRILFEHAWGGEWFATRIETVAERTTEDTYECATSTTVPGRYSLQHSIAAAST